jgi:hypothetical protein
MVFSPATLVPLVVAVSFAAGLNVYATILTLGMLARLHYVLLPPGLHAVADTWVLVAAAVLFAIEFFADKIPGFDVLWSAAHTFIRIPLAALLAFAATTQLPPEMQAVATLLGGALAMLAHTSKTAARILVTPSPEPVSNILLSSAEDVAAIGLTWVATQHPMAAGAVAAVLALSATVLIWFTARKLAQLWRRTIERFRKPGSALSANHI